MIIHTCAKVNLTLEMLRRRPDGYHDLMTVFQAIDLCDRIHLEPADELALTVSGADIPADASNLCWRAAALLAERAGRRPEVALRVEKRIPVGAGLGGGSGNAAGVLGALARLWQLDLGDEELVALGAELGSDVAFFLRGGAALGSGRGEVLEPLPAWSGRAIVVLAPREAVSTGRVYGALRQFRPAAGAASRLLADGLRSGNVPAPEQWLVNDLEAPAAEVSAAVRDDAERLAVLGLSAYRLSGSGGAWFHLADEADSAAVVGRLQAIWPGRAIWVTRPVTYGWCEVSEE